MNIARGEWCPVLAERVAAVAPDAAAIQRDVETGEGTVWVIDDGRAHLVTRIEDGGGCVECVVMFAGGSGLEDLADAVYNAARRAKCDRIRWHTTRPGIERIVSRKYQVQEIERVFAVEVPNG